MQEHTLKSIAKLQAFTQAMMASQGTELKEMVSKIKFKKLPEGLN